MRARQRERVKALRLINAALKQAEIDIDRKVLAEMALHDPAGFTAVVERANAA